MTDTVISKEAVEEFIQGPLKELVLSEGLPTTPEDTQDIYATVRLLRAQAKRIEELEARDVASEDQVEIVAKAMAYSVKQPNDASADADEYWEHTGPQGQLTWMVAAQAAIAAMPAREVKVNPLVWDWIGDKHAFGKGGGHSYEILYTYSPHSDIGQPPDSTKPWRSECVSFGEYIWHETAEAAQSHQQSRHDAIILSALVTPPAREVTPQEAAKVLLDAYTSEGCEVDFNGAWSAWQKEQGCEDLIRYDCMEAFLRALSSEQPQEPPKTLPNGKWCKCGFPHETGGPCWECKRSEQPLIAQETDT